jgi:hypothetical protein
VCFVWKKINLKVSKNYMQKGQWGRGVGVGVSRQRENNSSTPPIYNIISHDCGTSADRNNLVLARHLGCLTQCHSSSSLALWYLADVDAWCMNVTGQKQPYNT